MRIKNNNKFFSFFEKLNWVREMQYSIPPIIEKGNKNIIPKSIKIEFSDIKYNDSNFKKLILTKKFNRQEYITVNIVPIIMNKNKNKFFPFIIIISIIKSFEQNPLKKGKPHNPLINSGAIMTTSLIQNKLPLSDRFEYIIDKWTELSGGLYKVGFNYESDNCTSRR